MVKTFDQEKVNYEGIKLCLLELLELHDWDPLPGNAGVCMAVSKHIHGEFPSDDYFWVMDHAEEFGSPNGFVSDIGLMTPVRREFINFLLERISEEMAKEADDATN